MRRTTTIFSAALVLLALAPAAVMARHHRRHHSRNHHARIERFGRDVPTTSTTTNPSDNAGTVQRFHNGVLTIMLNDRSTISGAINRDTELECMAPEQTQTMHTDGDGGGRDQGGSDNSGSGDNQAQGSDDQSALEDQGDAAEQNDNQAEDQNEDQGEDQNENQGENNCSTSNLAPGTIVREAELRVSGTGNVWEKIELGS